MGVGIDRMILLAMVGNDLTVQTYAVCFDAYHALTVKGTPSAFPFSTSNGEVTATNDAGRLESVASAFYLLGVSRVELQLTKAAIRLAELNGDNGRASVKDKAFDEIGLGLRLKSARHGGKERRGLRLVKQQYLEVSPRRGLVHTL